MHEGVRRLIGDLNAAYRELPALHARDCEPEGFEWLIGNDHANSVFAWARKAPGSDPVVVISNLTPVPRDGYRVPMPKAGKWSRADQHRCRLVRRVATRATRARSSRHAATRDGLAGLRGTLPAAAGDAVSEIRPASLKSGNGQWRRETWLTTGLHRRWRARRWPMCWREGAARG